MTSHSPESTPNSASKPTNCDTPVTRTIASSTLLLNKDKKYEHVRSILENVDVVPDTEPMSPTPPVVVEVPEFSVSPAATQSVASPASNNTCGEFDLGLDFEADSEELIPPSPPNASQPAHAPANSTLTQSTQPFTALNNTKTVSPNLIGGLGAKVFLTPSQTTTSCVRDRSDVIEFGLTKQHLLDLNGSDKSDEKSDSECSDLLLADPKSNKSLKEKLTPKIDPLCHVNSGPIPTVPVARVTPMSASASKEEEGKPNSEDLFATDFEAADFDFDFSLNAEGGETERKNTPQRSPSRDVTCNGESPFENDVIGRVKKPCRALLLSPETPISEVKPVNSEAPSDYHRRKIFHYMLINNFLC